MFQNALRVALSLALFRGGPADMPFSLPLTRAALALAVFCTALLMSSVTPLPMALATGIGGAAGVAFFTRQLLRGRKLDNRLQQTLTAQLLVGSLFALAMWPAMLALAPTMAEMMTLMRAASETTPGTAVSPLELGESLKTKPPTWAALWSDVLFIWSLAASARINRLAADLGTPASWLMTVLGLFVLTGFVVMAQVVVAIVLF